MIRFKKNTTLEINDLENDAVVVESFDANTPYADIRVLNEITEKGDKFVDLQFDDGRIAIGVDRDSFEVITS